ncbi:MAG: hypothetical protein GXP56_02950 [Deltaproteobacteria bacterium]|nr:hypothetical protein [Deltaproteobacteria bacterium]
MDINYGCFSTSGNYNSMKERIIQFQAKRMNDSASAGTSRALSQYCIAFILFWIITSGAVQAGLSCTCNITRTCIPSLKKSKISDDPVLIYRSSTGHNVLPFSPEPEWPCCQKENNKNQAIKNQFRLTSFDIFPTLFLKNKNKVYHADGKTSETMGNTEKPVKTIPIYTFIQSFLC